MEHKKVYAKWLESAQGDDLRQELESIKDDDIQIKERFHGDLPFGTAGLRGIIGAGIARMNRYTVARATQGLSDFLKEKGVADKGMAIAYDSRHYSRAFAETTACVFAGNGIKAYLFEEVTSVPELSFAVRHLQTPGGVVITASHNPKTYNGYKVYAAYGGQLSPDDSLAVMARIQTVDAFSGINSVTLEQGIKNGSIIEVGADIDAQYQQNLLALCGVEAANELAVVYTPLHGAGLRTVKSVFPAAGIRNLYIVPEQSEPNGDFPTIQSPNPEDESAMEMAIALAKKTEADLVIGTDPDADRMGAAAKDESGDYRMLTGNQIGCILTAYLLEKRKQQGALSPTDYIVKSFVSTELADAIAQHYGVVCHTVLTGFRFISEIITRNEEEGNDFVFGFEESYGFLAGNGARDKDGLLAALLLCKAAHHYKKQGKSLFDVMEELYQQFGYYLEGVKNMAFAGLDGMERMNAIMKDLRDQPQSLIGGLAVIKCEDYQSGFSKHADGTQTVITLPRTNAIRFVLEDGAWVCVRPSGTEPKIKLYFAVRTNDKAAATKQLEALRTHFDTLM